MSDLWTERYRPRTLDDYVWSSQAQKDAVEGYLAEGKLANLMLLGPPGTGKTSLALMLLRLLKVDKSDIKMLNGCVDNGIDIIRDLENFVSTMPLGDFRYVVIDECLDESTLVWIMEKESGKIDSKPISTLNPSKELVMSYDVDSGHIEWVEYTLHDKGIQEVYEIQLANGEVVVCTSSHKWYVQDANGLTTVVTTDQLHQYTHILSPL